MDKSNLLRARCAGCNKSFFREDAIVIHRSIDGKADRKFFCDLDCLADKLERQQKKKVVQEQNKII